MNAFKNILFVTDGIQDEMDALKQALSLARNNDATIKILVVCPEFPKVMLDYKDKYEESIKNHVQKSIQIARTSIKLSETDISVAIEIESGGIPAIRVIRHVIRHNNDLVIKAAEQKETGKGFKAVDLELLRKCPCPVWLCRPIDHHRYEMRVAVAIDPGHVEPERENDSALQRELSERMLKLSRSLADTCSGELTVISCWEYEFEDYLRHNVWVKVKEDELQKIMTDEERQYRVALDNLIRQSNIGGNIQVHHVKGRPDQIIPRYIEEMNIDILVMGTVARTGIQGFIIGNTAENIMQNIGGSLVALKPQGFVSPVKPY